jgi:hypothetical protein
MDPPKIPPPRILDVPATVTPIEPARPTRLPEPPQPPRGAPMHPLAALLMMLVDNLWSVPELAVIDWFITVPLCFVMVFTSTFFIQKLVMKNRGRRALAFALLLGTIAAVPYSVTGTPVGLAFLAWTGVSRLLGKPAGKP